MKKIVLLVIGLALVLSACKQDKVLQGIEPPPRAEVKMVADTIHGIVIEDPYRYMEDINDSAVLKWMKAQNEYTRKVLSRIPVREEIHARVKELEEAIPATLSGLQIRGDRLFYLKETKEDEVAKLYYRDGLKGDEFLLVDPMSMMEGETSYSINYFEPANQGDKIAFGISPAGSENAVMYFMDIATKEIYEESIDRAQFGSPSWNDAGTALTYNRLQKLKPGQSPQEIYLNSEVWYHVLGTDPATDVLLFSNKNNPDLGLIESDFPVCFFQKDLPYIFGAVIHGVENNFTLFRAPFEGRLEKIEWIKLFGKEDKITGFDIFEDQIYFLTYKNAPRYKLASTGFENPDFENAEVLIPESKAILNSFTIAKDALYVEAMEGGLGKILRVSWSGELEPEELELPVKGAVGLAAADHDVPGLIFTLRSWTRAYAYYRFDPVDRKVIKTGIKPEGPFDSPENIVSEEVLVESHDGVEVPMSIIYRSDLKRNGQAPTLLRAYGSYGISIEPSFNPSMLAWLERDGIYAVAHVRGGGEYGDEWHRSGQKKNKPNTWKDFIACARYLIDEEYTSSDHISGMGGSAGGITVGMAMTEKPDLFQAIVSLVGSSNPTRAEAMPGGPANYPEFGDPRIREEFVALHTMDAYQHVEDGVVYPAVLLTAGINDPRVVAWMPAKMAARLQAANAGDNPILLRVDFEAGHGIGSTKSQEIEEMTDIFSFLFWQLE